MQAVVEALSVGNLCSCSHCGAIAVLSESCKLGQSLKSIKALNVALKFCLSAGRVSCSFDATLGSIEASPQRQSQICSITKKPLATWTSHSQHQTNFGAVEQWAESTRPFLLHPKFFWAKVGYHQGLKSKVLRQGTGLIRWWNKESALALMKKLTSAQLTQLTQLAQRSLPWVRNGQRWSEYLTLASFATNFCPWPG